jgi:Na+-transporting NADH:ubiquinone oxidoreductase subunit A
LFLFVSLGQTMIKIKRGLDLPISGAPRQALGAGNQVRRVALVGFDYHGLKPSMLVREGEAVKLGQALFSDKKMPGVIYTAPGAGRVAAIHRGEKRAFQAIEIELDEKEASVSFAAYSEAEIEALDAQAVRGQLLASGLWTAFSTRPFSKVPNPEAGQPSSIFVTAMDTNPLAADPAPIIAQCADDFLRGLKLLAKLAPKVFVCAAEGADIPGKGLPKVEIARFAGVHPAGLPGTHIHFLDPVDAKKTVWQIGAQDVLAIGKLFASGDLWVERTISLAGPAVRDPRLIRTRLGASLSELAAGELKEGENRIISGSVFGGRTGIAPFAFLGRRHTQVSCLHEGRERELLSFFRPWFGKFSVLPVCASALAPGKRFAFSTAAQGSPRAILPVGAYEKVMPLDILATPLLRYLVVGDTDMAQKLGALELDEEDLALCSFVCAGKYEYGPILRDVLTRIELEG